MGRVIFFADEDGNWWTNDFVEWENVTQGKMVIELAPVPRLKHRLKVALRILLRSTGSKL